MKINLSIIRRFWFLACFLIISPDVFAQLILDFSPKASRFPREVLKIQQISNGTAEVSDSFQWQIGKSAVTIADQSASLDLGFLFYSRSQRRVDYEGFDSTADSISASDSYMITSKDLPENLYKEYGHIGIPIWIGESRLNLFYGQLTVSDNKDISDEDIVRFIDVEYYLTPEAESTWLFGWYYADAFGGIYNVPFLGYVSKSNELVAVQLVFPVKWSVGVAFDSGWVLGIGQQVEGEAYRLTEKAPWNSAIVSFTGVKSIAGIGYHFASGIYIRIEGGTITQQKIDFYKDTISVSAAELSEEAYLSDDIPLLELSLENSTFYGISLSWAF